MKYRLEKDKLGERKIPADALYGIHADRARENFPGHIPFHSEWYKALGTVKLACYQTYQRFKDTAAEQLGKKLPLEFIPDEKLRYLMQAAEEISRGDHFPSFILPAVQGGAGTSINMNINEILANRALLLAGREAGDYEWIDPIEEANIYQSTNDVVPTALTLAAMQLLNELEEAVNDSRKELESLETKHRHDLRPGYTQMQEAVPSSFGMLFAAYNEALSRDWWRVSKCFERIKGVNLGGGAIGTGLAIPRYFIMEVVPVLQKLSGLPLTRSENLPDATSNLDNWVEIHAILKAHAVNLEKIVSDLRLMASDVAGKRFISLPQQQVGSSIMPGKVNPVIPEFLISTAHKVYANDQLITGLAASGCLDLNANLPLIGHAVLESLKLLINGNFSLKNQLLKGLTVHADVARKTLYYSPSITTALSPYIGYHRAGELAAEMQKSGCTVFEANRKLELIEEKKLEELLEADQLLKLGFSLKDLPSDPAWRTHNREE